MIENIADDAYASPCRADVVVGVDDDVIIPCKSHYCKCFHDSQECLIGVADDDVINEAKVVRASLTGLSVKLLSEICRAFRQFVVVILRPRRYHFSLDIFASPVSKFIGVIGNIEETHCPAIEVGEV